MAAGQCLAVRPKDGSTTSGGRLARSAMGAASARRADRLVLAERSRWRPSARPTQGRGRLAGERRQRGLSPARGRRQSRRGRLGPRQKPLGNGVGHPAWSTLAGSRPFRRPWRAGAARKAAPVVVPSIACWPSCYCDTAQVASASSTTVAWGAPPPAAEHSSVTVWVPAPTTAEASGDTDASTMVNPPAGEA